MFTDNNVLQFCILKFVFVGKVVSNYQTWSINAKVRSIQNFLLAQRNVFLKNKRSENANETRDFQDSLHQVFNKLV